MHQTDLERVCASKATAIFLFVNREANVCLHLSLLLLASWSSTYINDILILAKNNTLQTSQLTSLMRELIMLLVVLTIMWC